MSEKSPDDKTRDDKTRSDKAGQEPASKPSSAAATQARTAPDKNAADKNASGKPVPDKPAHGKSAGDQAGKAKGTAAPSAQDKPVQGKAEQSKPDQGKSGQAKPAEGKTAQTKSAAATGGRRPWLVVVVLLLLLVAGGASGSAWWLWQRLQHSEQAAASQRQGMETALATLRNQQEANQQRLTQQLQGLREQQDADRAALQTLREQEGRGRGDWQVAEAEYLVRIANNRLQLERDVGTALSALESADARLRETGDPALLDARKTLANDIQALRATARPDVAGMSMAVSGVVNTLDKLPLSGLAPPPAGGGIAAQGAAPRETAPAANTSDWRRMLSGVWDTLKTLVVIRQHAKPVRPLLPPEQRYFLTENLRLMLEQARLALLREDNADFQQRLATARQWIETYFDTEAPATRGALQTLDELAKQDIHPALPDISGALKAIERYRQRHPAGEAASGAETKPASPVVSSQSSSSPAASSPASSAPQPSAAEPAQGADAS